MTNEQKRRERDKRVEEERACLSGLTLATPVQQGYAMDALQKLLNIAAENQAGVEQQLHQLHQLQREQLEQAQQLQQGQTLALALAQAAGIEQRQTQDARSAAIHAFTQPSIDQLTQPLEADCSRGQSTIEHKIDGKQSADAQTAKAGNVGASEKAPAAEAGFLALGKRDYNQFQPSSSLDMSRQACLFHAVESDTMSPIRLQLLQQAQVVAAAQQAVAQIEQMSAAQQQRKATDSLLKALSNPSSASNSSAASEPSRSDLTMVQGKVVTSAEATAVAALVAADQVSMAGDKCAQPVAQDAVEQLSQEQVLAAVLGLGGLGGASALIHDLSSVLGSGQLTQAQVQAAQGLSTMPSVGSTLPPLALLGTQLPQQTPDHNLVMLRLGILSQRIQEAAHPQSDMSPFSSLNSLSNFSSLNSRTIGSSMSTWAPISDQDRVSAFQVAARHRTHSDEGGSSSSAQHAHTLSHTHSHYHDHDDLIADAEVLASITSIASINSVSSTGSRGRASSPHHPLRSLHSRRRKDSDEPQECQCASLSLLSAIFAFADLRVFYFLRVCTSTLFQESQYKPSAHAMCSPLRDQVGQTLYPT